MSRIVEVAVIGAGPYGLSVAAHLRASGIESLVFGEPMGTWARCMPQGMKLKSEAFASSLSDPDGVFTLGAFCRERGLPYADLGHPVPVEVFAAYGEAFAARFVPHLDRRHVRTLSRPNSLFRIELDDGAVVVARNVVIAAGIRPYAHVPAVFAGLPAERLSHTADRADYSAFAGRRVAVIGAGASAIDAAAALTRAGAAVRLVGRREAVTFHPGGRRRWHAGLAAPLTPLGPGWRKLACARAPLLFRLLPEEMRVRLVRGHLGPAPGASARADFENKVALTLGSTVTDARVGNDGVVLSVASTHHSVPDDARRLDPVDHVVLGTGYRLDIAALPFLAPPLRAEIALLEGAPRLSARFESSVPGLYFAGTAAAYTFGPLLRFVCGSGFAARRISGHLAGRRVGRLFDRVAGRPGGPSADRFITRPLARRDDDGATRALFVSVMNDVGCDRIVSAMGGLGCRCAVLAPPDSFAAASRRVSERFILPGRGGVWARRLALASRLARAVRDFQPDVVVPLDDCAARSLRDPRLLARVGDEVAALLAASLGDPRHFATVTGRETLIAAAADAGVRVPRQRRVASLAEARDAAAAMGLPAVLKREQTCGGFGVAVVRDAAALDAAFVSASRVAWAKRAMQALLRLGSSGGDGLVLQGFVPGPLAFRTVACRDGRVLDGISFVADAVHPPVTGASTVLRPLRGDRGDDGGAAAAMEAAARTLVARLGCSGFVSLDFILSPQGAVLIEMNPRPVTSAHLGRLYGHDLAAALLAGLTGAAAPVPVASQGPRLVALFPRELDRDRASPLIEAAPAAPRELTPAILHDVPWDDPGVLPFYARWLQSRAA